MNRTPGRDEHRRAVADRRFYEELVATGPVVLLSGTIGSEAPDRDHLPRLTLDYVSPSVNEVLGYERDQLTRAAIRLGALIDPMDRDHLLASWSSFIEGGSAELHVKCRIVRADGTQRDVTLHFRYDPFDPQRVFAHLVDVTELEEARRQALEASELAVKANQAKNAFLSRTSHELRTPLNSILGFAQLLRMSDLDHDQLRAVDHIQRAGDHLLGLINEVLDLARIEAGDMRLQLESLDVSSIVVEAIELMRPLAGMRHIDLQFDPNRRLRIIARGDRQRLLQVLLNVLSNAIKYNVEGGRVEVVLGASPADVRIEVHDTGPGLSSDQLRRAFVPFERLGAESQGIEGTGMGLPLAQSLIEAMTGRLEARSTPGRGSTFTVVLPRADQESDGKLEVTAETETASRLSSTVVLYIEDNLASLELLHAACRQRPNIILRTASEGRSGLRSAREHPPDIVLLDLHLPDMSGEEIVTELRADPHTATIPIVVVSADATPGRMDQLLTLGTDAYLTKPIDLNRLFAVLDDLGRRPAR